MKNLNKFKKIVTLSVILIVVATIAKTYAQNSHELPVYKDSSKEIEQRVEDLISRMTLEEKISMLNGASYMNTKENKRLCIPKILMTDGPLGPHFKGPSTNYSATINLAATFSTDLMRDVAENIGEETRVMGRNMLLAPMINIIRVPLWGRAFENFSEDPYLTAKMGVAYIKGVQSKNVIACAKVITANNQEWNRFVVDAKVDERALHEIYLPAMKAAVLKGDTWSVMSAYNKINGDYASENKYLLHDMLKQEWGFKGFVVSDWGGTNLTVKAAKAGLDLEMPEEKVYGKKLWDAVRRGEVSENMINEKVSRILWAMFKAHLFDESPEDYGGYARSSTRDSLAKEVAQKSMVLLKNSNGFLPLDKNSIRTIAVIGPNGNVARMSGSGSGSLEGFYGISPYQGIVKKVGNNISVRFATGIPDRAVFAPVAHPEFYTTKDGKPGIYAEYYNNKELEGEPVYTTIEKSIDFDWGLKSPKEGIVNKDKWSAKFTGKFKSPGDGWYEIGLKVDNGTRMYINGEKVLDVWLNAIAGKFYSTRYKFEKGRTYDIRVDFFENIGTCRLQLGFAPYNAEKKIKEAVRLASASDVVVMALGLDPTLEGESVDRKTLALPVDQIKLADSVLAANKNTMIVLYNGGPVTMDGWLDKTPSVIEAFYPGQEGGSALANILFGDANPSGKLPVTFPVKWEDTPIADSYPGKREIAYYNEGIFVGYRWYDKKNIEPLFPFGYGLSYTTFEFSDLKLSSKNIGKDDTLKISFTVKNTGKMAGDEIAQLYISDKEASVEREVKSLKGFKRISLNPGESKTVTMIIDKSALSFYDVNSKSWVVEPDEFEVLVGNSSRNILLKKVFKIK